MEDKDPFTDRTIDSRAAKTYGIALVNQDGDFHLLNYRLLTKENGEIISQIVMEELLSTGFYEILRPKIKFIMSDTSASQVKGNILLKGKIYKNDLFCKN